MTDSPNKIIPNSFQTPNFFVDECMPYLTGNEIMCVIFLARKTFGWQKRSDRISKSQIIQATGLNAETIDSCMEALVRSGIVLRVQENNARNEGVEWALQLDDHGIRFDWLKQRKADRELKQQHRTQKAREVRAKKGVGLLDNPTPKAPSVGQKGEGGGVVEQTEGGVVEQAPQKPQKAKKENSRSPDTPVGADAPARFSNHL
jgi:phage replication O-like protein O